MNVHCCRRFLSDLNPLLLWSFAVWPFPPCESSLLWVLSPYFFSTVLLDISTHLIKMWESDCFTEDRQGSFWRFEHKQVNTHTHAHQHPHKSSALDKEAYVCLYDNDFNTPLNFLNPSWDGITSTLGMELLICCEDTPIISVSKQWLN